MSQLSELDVQNLRHLIGGSETCKAKFETYAENATDSRVKQYFQQAAVDGIFKLGGRTG